MTNQKALLILKEDSSFPIVTRYADEFGTPGIDIRGYYYNGTGNLWPTEKGIRIPEDEYGPFLKHILRLVLGWTEDNIEAVISACRASGAGDLAIALEKILRSSEKPYTESAPSVEVLCW